jgi:hypothetical protein
VTATGNKQKRAHPPSAGPLNPPTHSNHTKTDKQKTSATHTTVRDAQTATNRRLKGCTLAARHPPPTQPSPARVLLRPQPGPRPSPSPRPNPDPGPTQAQTQAQTQPRPKPKPRPKFTYSDKVQSTTRREPTRPAYVPAAAGRRNAPARSRTHRARDAADKRGRTRRRRRWQGRRCPYVARPAAGAGVGDESVRVAARLAAEKLDAFRRHVRPDGFRVEDQRR